MPKLYIFKGKLKDGKVSRLLWNQSLNLSKDHWTQYRNIKIGHYYLF